MIPQNPGYPAFPPTYQQPQPAPVQSPAPWNPQPAQAPQPFLPQQPPPAQVPGYGPPVMQPQPGYQPQAYVPQNHYQGADQAQLTPRSAIVPLGQHLLEWQKMERTRTGKGKDMVFIKVKILDSSDKANVGLECAFMQNMQTQPPSIAFNALAKLVFPALGFNVADPAHKAQVDAILAQQKFSQWLLEIETKNTVEGRPMAGRQFVAQLTPGTRTEKTPPGKEPFPFINCVPFGPGLFA